MFAQHNRRGADADVPGLSALQFTRNFFKVRKKRPDEFKKFFTRRRQRKRPPVKQGYAEKFFELRDLGADRRLLDAVGNVPHRRHDAAVRGHAVKKFEMINVHVCRLDRFHQIRRGAERSN